MRGTIELYHWDQLIRWKKYDCVQTRDKIIESWKRLYGSGFSRTTLKDIPQLLTVKSKLNAKE